MKEERLAITLSLHGPVLTRSSAAGAYGVDAPFARDAQGRAILPGTLVKGRLREAWEELAALPGDPLGLGERLPRWLGLGSDEAAGEPRRGRLLLSDFVTQGGEEALRHRIQIDPELGAVRPHAFQTLETPFAAGETVSFRGVARFVPEDAAEADALRRSLEAGLRRLTHLGALRTVGFGRLLAVEVAPAGEAAAGPEAPLGEGDGATLELAFTLESPWCVSRPQPVANLFESATVLPGGTLKGALATSWRELLGHPPDGPVTEGLDPDRPELAAHFAKVRFTHALPARRDTLRRPVAPPLSLAKAGRRAEDGLYDALLAEGPGLVQVAGAWRAPKFAPDWKERADVEELCGWPRLRRETRVRTAVDTARRRAASEKLFGLETVVPEPEVAWLGRVELGAIADPALRARVREQLVDLLCRGLRGVGKTKARAGVEVLAAGSVSDALPRHPEPTGPLHAVLLQTPALLCDPARLRTEPSPEALQAAYAAVWEELSGGALRLVRFFAAQALAGGPYLWHEFQGGGEYEPYFLTREGSVFVLEAPDGREPAAGQALRGWEAGGLPVPRWAAERFAREGRPGDDWRNCPFVAENGYGEVLVDRAIHWERRLVPGESFRPLGEAEP